MAKKAAKEALYFVEGGDVGEYDFEYVVFNTLEEVLEYAYQNFEPDRDPVTIWKATVTEKVEMILERGGWVIN